MLGTIAGEFMWCVLVALTLAQLINPIKFREWQIRYLPFGRSWKESSARLEIEALERSSKARLRERLRAAVFLVFFVVLAILIMKADGSRK